MPAPLVALYSPRPGSGKSTVAHVLAQQSWQVIAFAEPLKAMAAALLDAAGYGQGEIETILSTDKQRELGYLAGAPTARHLLQTLGTAWGRELIHPQLWIELWEDRVRPLLELGQPVVCDDLRTPEEMAAVRALGGECWLIERPQGAINDAATLGHTTEGALAGARFDRTLLNAGSIADLQALVLKGLNDAA
jgi:hypothetical protein